MNTISFKNGNATKTYTATANGNFDGLDKKITVQTDEDGNAKRAYIQLDGATFSLAKNGETLEYYLPAINAHNAAINAYNATIPNANGNANGNAKRKTRGKSAAQNKREHNFELNAYEAYCKAREEFISVMEANGYFEDDNYSFEHIALGWLEEERAKQAERDKAAENAKTVSATLTEAEKRALLAQLYAELK